MAIQNPPSSSKRTARACVRCRKQKLKCDSYRPCALCVRANVVCVSRPEPDHASKKLSSSSSSNSRSHHPPHNSTQQHSQRTSQHSPLAIQPTSLSTVTTVTATATTITSTTTPSVSDNLDPRPTKIQRLAYSSDNPLQHSTRYSPHPERPRSFSLPDHAANRANLPLAASDNDSKSLPSSVSVFAGLTSSPSVSSPIPTQTLSSSQFQHPLLRQRPSFSDSKSPSDSHSSDHHSSAVVPPLVSGRSSTASILAQLPPRQLIDYSISVYFSSFHWFVNAVHENELLTQYRHLMSSYERDPSTVPNSDEDFATALLLTVVIALGSTYAILNPIRRKKAAKIFESSHHPPSPGASATRDLEAIVSRLVSLIRSHLADLLSCCTLATVQTCVLFGTFSLYHGDAITAWTLSGCAVSCSQALHLHREPENEACADLFLRRRVFWATYNLDRLSSVSFGVPTALVDSDCDVALPELDLSEMGPGSVSCCLLSPDENMNDGSSVTLLTYQTQKLKYYIIVGEIMRKLYCRSEARSISSYISPIEVGNESSESVKIKRLLSMTRDLEAKLRNWFDGVPQGLKLSDDGSYKYQKSEDIDSALSRISQNDPEDDGVISISEAANMTATNRRRIKLKEELLAAQALFLQLAFDNAMILIHKPLLAYRSSKSIAGGSAFAKSSKTCWSSALHTSRISHHGVFGNGHQVYAISFVGMHLFTAGVLLSIYGSSEPLSQRALESKLALSRIIQMRKTLQRQIAVIDLGFQVLENLARVVVQKEMEKILSGGNVFGADSSFMNDNSGPNMSEESKSDDHEQKTAAAAAVLNNLSSQIDVRPERRSISHSPGSIGWRDNVENVEKEETGAFADSDGGAATPEEKSKMLTHDSFKEEAEALMALSAEDAIVNKTFEDTLRLLQPGKYNLENLFAKLNYFVWKTNAEQ
ncbi:fungal-specific transcription factor domain-containing protein [Lipomyces oligophaga]|uniref:fungal-specific transcription factor domain-containing protein n=1 Tax=Lipomyces oligophaga TaxID=45792 RepID=UPI0034CFFD6B